MGTLWLALTPRWPYLMLGPGQVYLRALPVQLMPSWPTFYWAIVAVLVAQLAVRFFSLFRWAPLRRTRIADLILSGAGLSIGVLLLLKAPNYVSSPSPHIAAWANSSIRICVIAALAINLRDTGRLALSIGRERNRT